MKKSIILFVVGILSLNIQAQTDNGKADYWMEVYEITNKQLEPILDTVIATEMKREYHRDNMYFSLSFGNDSTIYLELVYALIKSDRYQGVVLYKGRTFFVAGSWFDVALKKAGYSRRYRLYSDTSYIDKCTGERIFILIREGFSQWVYRYKDGNIELLRFHDTTGKYRPSKFG